MGQLAEFNDPKDFEEKVETEKKKEKKEKREKREKKEKKEKKEKRDKKQKTECEKESEKESKTEAKSNKKDEPIHKNQFTKSSIKKDFYKEHEKTTALSENDIQKYHATHCIQIESSIQFKPILKFEYANFHKNILAACQSFSEPTPIQAQTWPIVMSGKDVIGIAQTGSGKTLAFALPAMLHLQHRFQQAGKARPKHPFMLVLCPTRELAMQSSEVFVAIGEKCGVSSACIYGGVNKETHRSLLRGGVDVVVATPGRLLDLIEDSSCVLSQVSYLVLDEADRMLDMGFEKDVRRIIAAISIKDRQTLMFSATWPVEIRKLAQEFLTDPVRVTIGSAELNANSNVSQFVEVVDPKAKDQKLIALLNNYHRSRNNRVIVFVLYKKEAVRVEQMLRRNGFKVASIHGDKNQHDRTQAFNNFKNGSEPLLIATDVAARGLDIPDVEYVINYTFPLTIEDYIHRIGRTGRGGKKGVSHTFFTLFDKAHSGELVNVLREANIEPPQELMKFGTHVKRKEHKLYGFHCGSATLGEATELPKAKHMKFD
eukprot:Sdes_comp18400_c0_seq1m8236